MGGLSPPLCPCWISPEIKQGASGRELEKQNAWESGKVWGQKVDKQAAQFGWPHFSPQSVAKSPEPAFTPLWPVYWAKLFCVCVCLLFSESLFC